MYRREELPTDLDYPKETGLSSSVLSTGVQIVFKTRHWSFSRVESFYLCISFLFFSVALVNCTGNKIHGLSFGSRSEKKTLFIPTPTYRQRYC